jgi:phosphatidylserine decarboxylase
MFQIFISSLAVALIILPLLAWKWHIKIRIAIAIAFIIGGLTGLIVSWIYSQASELAMATMLIIEFVIVLLMTLVGILLRFYRDPERHHLENDGVILSPADGKIIYVSKVEKGSSLVSTKRMRTFRLDEIAATDLLSTVAYLVGVEMNLLDVHVNRSPIGGKIILQKRIKGQFLSLGKPESENLNERVTTIIDNEVFRIGVVQIASRLVRSIVCYVKTGDKVTIGQRIGMIRFGSQVDIAIPQLENLEMSVRPSDEVKAGISVIARYG